MVSRVEQFENANNVRSSVDGRKRSFSKTLTSNGHVISVSLLSTINSRSLPNLNLVPARVMYTCS